MYLGDIVPVTVFDQWKNRVNAATMSPVRWNGVEIGFMFDNPLNGRRNYAQTYSGQVGTGSSGKLQYVRPNPSTAILKQTQFGGIQQQLQVYGPDGKMVSAPVFANNPVYDPTTQVNEASKNNLAPWKDIAPLAVFVALPVAAAAITAAGAATAATGAAGTAGAGTSAGAAGAAGTGAAGAAGTGAASVATAATVAAPVATTTATVASVAPAATAAGMLGTAKAVIGAGMTAFGAYQKFAENKAKAAQAKEQEQQMLEAQRFVEAQQQADFARAYEAEANEYARAAGMWIPGVDNRVTMAGGAALLAAVAFLMLRRRSKRRRLRSA